jgi:membrane-associated PAP2 superfamily phosphatase
MRISDHKIHDIGVEQVRKILRNKRAVTPVLSTLLLMVIAVAAMSIAITATYVITGNLHDTMGERFIVEDAWFTTGKISFYLRNVGKVAIKIAAVYVNHTSQLFTPLKLEVDDHSWLNVTCGWNSHSVYYVNIVTSRGTKVVDYYESPA